MLKLEVSGERKENVNKKVWTPGLHFLFVSKFASWAFTSWEMPPPTPPPAPLALPCHSHPLVSPSPCYFWARSLFVCPGAIQGTQAHVWPADENKGREDGSREQSGPCKLESRRHTELIPEDAKLPKLSLCVWVPRMQGKTTVFRCALQIISWFLQSSFPVVVF